MLQEIKTQQSNEKLLFEFYNFVLDEHGGCLNESQIDEFLALKEKQKEQTEVDKSILVSLEGKFYFEINQTGLETKNEAIDNFKECFREFIDNLVNLKCNIPVLNYDFKDIDIS